MVAFTRTQDSKRCFILMKIRRLRRFYEILLKHLRRVGLNSVDERARAVQALSSQEKRADSNCKAPLFAVELVGHVTMLKHSRISFRCVSVDDNRARRWSTVHGVGDSVTSAERKARVRPQSSAVLSVVGGCLSDQSVVEAIVIGASLFQSSIERRQCLRIWSLLFCHLCTSLLQFKKKEDGSNIREGDDVVTEVFQRNVMKQEVGYICWAALVYVPLTGRRLDNSVHSVRKSRTWCQWISVKPFPVVKLFA